MMRSDYTKKGKSKYRAFEKEVEAMTVNRQVNYGYRGTAPNSYLNYPPKEGIKKSSFDGNFNSFLNLIPSKTELLKKITCQYLLSLLVSLIEFLKRLIYSLGFEFC